MLSEVLHKDGQLNKRSIVKIERPLVVEEYNMHMGGVDPVIC